MGKLNHNSALLWASLMILTIEVTNSIAEQTKAPVVAVATQPIKPTTPQCYGFFPGTPGWNECFQKFMQDMATYQMQMHEYVKNKAQAEEGADPNQHYSESSYSNAKSTSNSFVAGYAIRAINMPISSSINNNVLKVTLYAGPIEKFESKVVKNEIQLSLVSKGVPKYVKIIVPKNIDIKDVSVDRTTDTIYLTGPVADSNGNVFQYSQSSASNSGTGGSFSSSTNMNHGDSVPIPPMAPVPMPDFQNMFGNMFQNMFQGIFGARSMPAKDKDYMRSVEQYQNPYYSPQVWFF